MLNSQMPWYHCILAVANGLLSGLIVKWFLMICHSTGWMAACLPVFIGRAQQPARW